MLRRALHAIVLTTAICVVLAAGERSRAAQPTPIWIEAEKPAASNFPHFETSNMGKPALLSAGQWIMKGISGEELQRLVPDEGVRLAYDFEAAGGEHDFWARVGWYQARADFRWRIDEGDWHEVPHDHPTVNLMELGFFTEASWANLGKVRLAPGRHRLEIHYPKDRSDKPRMLMALDCFAFLQGPFTPEGPFRPGENYDGPQDRAAAEQVYALPEVAGAARREVTLNGLWQVARYDDPDMDRDTYEPVRRLPTAEEYRLRWMGINVPGSVWAVEPLVFGHRLIYRTRVRVPESHAGRAFKLHFSGTNWIVSVFVNGRLAGTHQGVWVPWELDVSEHLRPGEVNEIALAVKGTYYAMDAAAMGDPSLNHHRNRPLSRKSWTVWVAPMYPSTKGDGDGYEYGIVAPVTLISAGRVYTDDVFVKPSVKEQKLGLELSLRNTTSRPEKLSVACEAVYDRSGRTEKRWALRPVAVEAKGTRTIAVALDWQDPKLWWPEPEPHLYRLRTTLSDASGETIDVHEQLFGFREVTVEGTGVRINGVRRNFWCWVDVRGRPKSAAAWLEEFRREKNRFARFAANRKTREFLPTREARLEFYDRHGVAGRLCTMIDGMFITFRLGQSERTADGQTRFVPNERLWENFRRHMAQVARAYRNHPSVIMYQTENELVYITGMNRYGGHLDQIEALMDEVVQAGRLQDDTRPYTVGGAGDLSGRLPINSPHYPLAAFDTYPENAYTLEDYSLKIRRWPWDRTKPWIVGESCFANHLEFGTIALGDEAFRGQEYARRGKAAFLRMLYGGYRWAGAAGFFPWDNLSDFDDSQKVFSPLAAIPRKQTHRLYGGRTNRLLFKVMNDTLSEKPVTLRWSYAIDGREVAAEAKILDIEPGTGREHEIVIHPPETDRRREGTLTLAVSQEGEETYVDKRSVPVLPVVRNLRAPGPFYVLDRQGRVVDWLEERGIEFQRLDTLAGFEQGDGLLIVGPNALTPSEAVSPKLLAFAARGGSVICLEQEHPLAGPALPGPITPTSHFGGYAHPEALGMRVFGDLGKDDLIDWAGDHPTYQQVYQKPSGGRSLASAGDRLQFSPLVEVPCGRGVLLLCQLRVGAKLGLDPAADVLLRNFIDVYGDYAPASGVAAAYLPDDEQTREKIASTGILLEDVDFLEAALDAKRFRVAIVRATPDNLRRLNQAAERVSAFLSAGGWIMLTGLGPEGIDEFNRLAGTDHLIRPFRLERVTLDQSDHKLAATLSHRDVAMFSPKKIQHTTYWVSPDTFTYVIDHRDFAPFTLPPGASDDPMEFDYPWDLDHPDHAPYNFVNGMLGSDDWRYVRQIWIGEGERHHDLVFRLRRPDVLKAVKIWNNTNYATIETLDIILDGEASRTFRMTLPAASDPVTLELPEAQRVEKTITLRIRSWRDDSHRKFEGGTLVGIDNVQFLRPEEASGEGVFLDSAGGLVALPRGSGGLFLNQIKFMEEEPRPENEEKKRKLLSTILQNMGVGLRSASVVAVPGYNVRFHPIKIQEQCNAFLADRGEKKGWFHHREELPGGLDMLPRGENEFADVPYHIVDYATAPIPDFILVGGPRARLPGHLAEMPAQVEGIPVGRKADKLYFLHTGHITVPLDEKERQRRSAREEAALPTVLKYVLHYADGKTAEIPVVLERHIDHWVRAEPIPLPEARIGWSRKLDALEGRHAVLFSMQADNPRPDVEITAIDVVREESRGAFAVLAITLGEVLRGEPN